MHAMRWLGACAAAAMAAFSAGGALSAPRVPDLTANRNHVILAWNNLGMHCYNRDCSAMAVLPPYNTLWAQLVRIGDPPRIVTDGVTIEYMFPYNTTSAAKTNFWAYERALFGVATPPDVGLAGKGLSGVMDLDGDHFIAEGIPLTEYGDADVGDPDPMNWTRSPYQTALLIAKDSRTGEILARNIVVAPVSSELDCGMCHADDGDATTSYPITPTGAVETNILTLHDYLNPGAYSPSLMDSRPVLCARCHASAALGAPGLPGVTSLSRAVHLHHKDLPDITPDTDGCYNCHPGPETQCLRCTMSQNFAFNCTTCHGTMETVAQNPDPWLNEPRCDSAQCHGAGFALTSPLYRESKGHGRMYCAGCHDSPHAIAPSREPADGIKLVALDEHLGTKPRYTAREQAVMAKAFNDYIDRYGNPGTLRDCTVCHASPPNMPFVHRAP